MKRALADVLWEAANRRLSVTERDKYPATSEFSCIAADLALYGDGTGTGQPGTWLVRLSDYEAEVGHFQRKYPFDTDRQAARYVWLLLAMHVAADEKIMVETA